MPGGASAGVLEALAQAQHFGIIGRAPLAQHLEHAHGFGDLIDRLLPACKSVIDLGTGGGLPGLVLADRFQDVEFTLLDGRDARTETLAEAVTDLGLADRVHVVAERAERFGQHAEHRGAFDCVVARGFARPSVTAECAAPLLFPGGTLIVSEPPDGTRSEERWPAAELRLLGLTVAFTSQRNFHYAVMQLDGVCPREYPRRVGIPEKRPLF